MDESQLMVHAVVKVPLFPSFDIIVRSLLKQAAEVPLDTVGCDGLSDACQSLVAQTCLQLVPVSCSTLIENLAPLTAYWCKKALKLFDKVPPEKCFFGVQKKDITVLMKKVLLEYLVKVCQRKKFEGCSSFYALIHMLAEEVTKKVNTHLAMTVLSSDLLNSECQCIPLPTLNVLIHHLANTVRCWNLGKCECPLLMSAACEANNPAAAAAQPDKRRLCVKLGIFEVTYTSSDAHIMHVLSYITDFTYACNPDVTSPVWFQQPSNLSECNTHTSVEDCGVLVAVTQEDTVAVQENPPSPPPASSPDQTEAVAEDVSAEPQPDNSRTPDVTPEEAPPQEDGLKVETEAPQTPPRMTELDKKHEVVILLLVGLLLLTQEKAQTWLSQEESDTAINNLSSRVKLYTARFEDITISSKRSSVDRTKKRLFDYFCKFYSSPRELLQALISQDQKTITFIVTALMTQLVLWSSTRRGPVARCFSHVGKALRRSFRACFKTQ